MRINWKVRFKNKVWLGSFFSLVVGFIYSLLALFDVFPAVTQNLVVQLLNQVLTFLGLIGVIVDPTTAGLEDSDRAMGYEEPWGSELNVSPVGCRRSRNEMNESIEASSGLKRQRCLLRRLRLRIRCCEQLN